MSSTNNRNLSELSEYQKQFYQDNGYIVIKGCVPLSDLQKYNQRFLEICDRKAVPRTMTIMRDVSIAKQENRIGQEAVTKVQDFYDDDALFHYCLQPTVVDIVKQLIGGSNIVAMHTMLINKPPDSGNLTSRHPMHQDLNYFPFRPADHVCCAWTAMERVNRSNGCLVVVPGSHKGPLHPHGYPNWEGGVNRAYHGIQDYNPDSSRVHVEMEAGDTVLFHPTLIHGSGANRTAGYRKAISCHYANDDVCRYTENVDYAADETLKDVLEMAKMKIRKIGQVEDLTVEYEDIWRVRARPVTGIKSHL